ncbi:MAG: translational GTPase TypA [Bdellovibrionales bacterium CG12_big_fil_rev_8_21_14_0_65_38_15]|nr:MAG: translational GTPase TypA [Bdellovibrionales bacterium CG22_combo_CG10-13_8_21_14_all_38_13]PIQ54492.1 MAG: translational GTPase TypA [Bdellovibrionales bacterium CG12_big_fil_rev_8_21_14_0_65_38_15]PIR29873.1 MAG: translational GTPase TypA [Bdellovibrionales bacterium CG11_big_fil_rev_8_21_14_0_20_38_13]
MSQNYQKLKNIAVVAHVDHGKTTMVDELLKQSGTFGEREQVAERVMDSGDIERERGITITAKNCAFRWKDVKINLLDTPGHADFGGEVERSLMMVDGVLLLVDAAEGPLPQTRFVLTKAMQKGIKIAVVINKVDRQDERIDEVKNEIEDLFLELADILELPDFDIDIPFFYASGRNGWASNEQGVQKDNLVDLLDFMISDFYPEPQISEGPNLQLLVTNLSYSAYLGSLFIGRIQRGTIKKNQQFTQMGEGDKKKNFKVSAIQMFDKLGFADVDEASAGEIVIVAGLDDPKIGDTIVSPGALDALERLTVEPPTVAVNVSVSTSPLSGKDGDYLTSRKLEEFLVDACRTNVALKYEGTDDPKVYRLKGRGELQLAIVFEELRRKGFELMVSRPEVLFKEDESGEKLEPYEKVVLDIPNDATGSITEKLAIRKGRMEAMTPLGDTRTRMVFIVPSRGLIGYRGVFLTDTRGEGLMSSEFLGYQPYAGDMLARNNGAIISDQSGKATAYALFNLLGSGKQFISPGEQVYEGMVIGEHTRSNDLVVNCCREKQLTNVRTAGKDENMVFPTIPNRTLEWALDWIDNDEWVEVTPLNIRVRKKVLQSNLRSVRRK